ncbi:uncharacterized protein LOC135847662 isoform X2 [Planococcus citri]|uniref:uncharacterized protein LOC135847662 isoform X2 n=1 Tax=Planococcus citri TaxID=170843 RepID=UPI0031FA40B5
MEDKEKQPCLENTDSAETSKRTRIMKRSAPFPASDEDDFSSSDDSDDEWNVSRKQKVKRNKKTVFKQTLKSKLLEKTKKLRQLSKSTSALAEAAAVVEECIPTEEKVSSIPSTVDGEKNRIASPVKTKLEQTSNENDVTSSRDTKPSLDRLAEKIKCESSASNIEIKNDDDVSRHSVKNKDQHDRKPIVIEYSTNHFQVSGMNTSPANFSQPFPSQMDPSIISSQVVSAKSTVSEKHGDSNKGTSQSTDFNYQCERNFGSSQFPSNITARISPSNVPNMTATNRRKVSIPKTRGAPSKQKPAADSHKLSSSSITRLNNVKIVKNHKIDHAPVTRPRKMCPENQNPRLSSVGRIVKNTRNIDASIISEKTMLSKGGCSLMKTSATRVLNKFGDISPSGTVIHTGTGSVTITPRKIVPEKPPKQRKLFKNEIEDLQVEKLREQHQGALPIKLKIPVPSDVADKIEPSFLIED